MNANPCVQHTQSAYVLKNCVCFLSSYECIYIWNFWGAPSICCLHTHNFCYSSPVADQKPYRVCIFLKFGRGQNDSAQSQCRLMVRMKKSLTMTMDLSLDHAEDLKARGDEHKPQVLLGMLCWLRWGSRIFHKVNNICFVLDSWKRAKKSTFIAWWENVCTWSNGPQILNVQS